MIGITIHVPLVVAQQQVVAVAADDVFRLEGDLAAAAGGVDHVVGHRVARRVAPQALDDLHALGDRRAEVRRAGNRVALVEVIGTDPHLSSPWTNCFIVSTLLLTPPSSTVWQPSGMPASASRVHAWSTRASFVGVGEVDAHPERMMLPQHAAQLGRDPLRQDGGHFRAQPQELDVRDPRRRPENPVEPLVAHGQRIAAGDEDVADGRRLADVFEPFQPGFGRGEPCPTTATACSNGSRSSRSRGPGAGRGPDSDGPGRAPGCRHPRPGGRWPRPVRSEFGGRRDHRPPQGLVAVCRVSPGWRSRG